MQLTHYKSKFKPRNFPIILVCEDITNAANVGSLFRTADAFGIEKLLFCGHPIPLGRKMTKTSRATEKYVNFEWIESTENALLTLRDLGYQMIALEITTTSTSLFSMDFTSDYPIALLIGDENFGVSEIGLRMADAIVHIEMFGQNSSMNVVQAANIALYEITKQLIIK